MTERKWICNGVEFKVGDKVKIVREVTTRNTEGMGCGATWKNSWHFGLSEALGESGTINEISEQGACIDGVSYSWPLKALKRIAITLPSGSFTLIGKDGITYGCSQGYKGFTCVDWRFLPSGTIVSLMMASSEVVTSIESGFWSIQKSAEQVAKEAQLVRAKASLEILTNEILKLEKEIAQ